MFLQFCQGLIGKEIQDVSLLNHLITTGFTKGDELLLATDMRGIHEASEIAGSSGRAAGR